MTIKQELYKQCKVITKERLKVIQDKVIDIQNALQSETKSSAGDKHEIGRAMLQLEREKAGQQLAEVQKLEEVLQRISPKTQHNTVALGSVVYTSQANYFIAISAGEIKIRDNFFYAISPSTPIAKLLLSKKVNDTVQFRNSNFVISKIE